jgi:hypothetical protein
MGLPTCLLLEYGVSTAAVAFGWSQSVNSCWTGVRHRAAQCRAARHGIWRSSPAGGDLVGFFVNAPPDETTTSPASPPRSASTGITVAARNRAARGGAHGVLAGNRRPPSRSKVSSDPNDAEHHAFQRRLDPGRRPRRRPDRGYLGLTSPRTPPPLPTNRQCHTPSLA